jgi:hypothetical protein
MKPKQVLAIILASSLAVACTGCFFPIGALIKRAATAESESKREPIDEKSEEPQPVEKSVVQHTKRGWPRTCKEVKIGPCPTGTEVVGCAPPDGFEQYCARKDEIGNPVKHGLFTSWYDNGQKASEGDYEDGNHHGPCTFWYSNGQKRLEAEYRHGKPHGRWFFWTRDGQKHKEVEYEDTVEIITKTAQGEQPSQVLQPLEVTLKEKPRSFLPALLKPKHETPQEHEPKPVVEPKAEPGVKPAAEHKLWTEKEHKTEAEPSVKVEPKPETKPGPKPEHVPARSGAFVVNDVKMLWGMGTTSNISNPYAASRSADLLARRELVKLIQTHVTEISERTPGGKRTGISRITKMTLERATIVDRWVEPKSGRYYAVAAVELYRCGLHQEKADRLWVRLTGEGE